MIVKIWRNHAVNSAIQPSGKVYLTANLFSINDGVFFRGGTPCDRMIREKDMRLGRQRSGKTGWNSLECWGPVSGINTS